MVRFLNFIQLSSRRFSTSTATATDVHGIIYEFNLTLVIGPLAAYERLVQGGRLANDPFQHRIIVQLQSLHEAILHQQIGHTNNNKNSSSWSSWLNKVVCLMKQLD